MRPVGYLVERKEPTRQHWFFYSKRKAIAFVKSWKMTCTILPLFRKPSC